MELTFGISRALHRRARPSLIVLERIHNHINQSMDPIDNRHSHNNKRDVLEAEGTELAPMLALGQTAYEIRA